VDAAVRGVAQNAITQGIAVATRLQSNFDWAGVASAGVGAGVGHWVGGGLPSFRSNASIDNIGRQLGTGAAAQLASAATRSAINGETFDDNFAAALPDVIGNAIGSLVADRISKGGVSTNGSDDPAKSGDAANAKGSPATIGAGDGAAAQPTAGAGGDQIGGGTSNVNAGDSGRLAGPDYLNPPERIPTSLAQLDSDEAALEAANNAYRSSHNGQDYQDYQKYKDNIAGWRQTLGQDQSQPVVTIRPAQSDEGGWYANFGLGLGGGFNLHFDRNGVTGSVGAGLFGRANVGYAFTQRALDEVRVENKYFGEFKLGSSGLGAGFEAAENFDSASGSVGPLALKYDSHSGLNLNTSFDVDRRMEGGPKVNAEGLLSPDKAVSFGLDAGLGWLHTGRTLSGH